MNREQFRSAINAEIQAWGTASFPTLPIIYENGPVPDEDKIGQIWLDVSIRWYGGKQLAVGGAGRYTGVVSLQVYYREAQGTKAIDGIIDSLELLLKGKRFGTAVLNFPEPSMPTNLQGWYKAGLMFPFTLDR